MRIVIAEDSVLLRAGLTRILADAGEEVVATVGDADELMVGRRAAPARPVRRRRAHAADAHRRRAAGGDRHPPALAVGRHPRAVAVRRGALRDRPAGRRDARRSGTSSRTASPTSATSSARCGGWATAGRRSTPRWSPSCSPGRRRDPLERLTPREREVLALMAEGRTNPAIARSLVVTDKAVEKHVSNIFTKLDLPPAEDDHRRVLAVLQWVRS